MAHTSTNPAVGDGRARQRELHFGRNVPAEEIIHSATTTQAASGPPDSGRVAKSSLAALPAPLGVEQSDDYPRVIIALNPKWRVIACPNALQWILQRRQGKRWRGYWFCRTRETLIRGAREHAGTIGGDALVILLRLPERFPEAAP